MPPARAQHDRLVRDSLGQFEMVGREQQRGAPRFLPDQYVRELLTGFRVESLLGLVQDE